MSIGKRRRFSLGVLLLAGICLGGEDQLDPVIRVEEPAAIVPQKVEKQIQDALSGKSGKLTARVIVNGKACDPNDPTLSKEVRQAIQRALDQSRKDLKRVKQGSGRAKMTMMVNGKKVERTLTPGEVEALLRMASDPARQSKGAPRLKKVGQ